MHGNLADAHTVIAPTNDVVGKAYEDGRGVRDGREFLGDSDVHQALNSKHSLKSARGRGATRQLQDKC